MKRIKKIALQTTSGTPESDSSTVEILDEKENAFMEFYKTSPNTYEVRIYRTDRDITLPLDELERAIAIAKKNIYWVPMDERL